MGGVRRIGRYALRQWRWLTFIGVLTAASAVAVALQPWPLKILIDHALGEVGLSDRVREVFAALGFTPTPLRLVVLAALASLAVFGANSLLEIALGWARGASGQLMVFDLATDLFDRLHRLSLLFHSKRPLGDALSRLSADTYCVQSATEAMLLEPAQQLLTIAMVGGLAWHLDPHLTLVSLAAAPVLVASAAFFGRRLKGRARRTREAQSRILSFVHQTLTALPMVQAFGAEHRNRERFGSLAADVVAAARRGTVVRGAYGLVNGLANAIGVAVVLYFGGRRVLAGALSIGSLVVFVAYIRTLQGAMMSLVGSFAKLKSIGASVDRVLEVLDADEGVRDVPGARDLVATPSGSGVRVRLEEVTFGYEPGHPVLYGVTLEAEPGEMVALVGTTGAGKSTLVSLIPRFFDPQSGRVLFDGVDVRGVRLASLRSRVALVLQEPFLLPLSVAENIAYGRPGARPEEIVAAAVAANADEFIERLPEGYATVIGERGATLSGGQKQRLAIARALLKDAPVLILDEPTAALDAETEARVMEALERLMAGRTTFLVAHRLSTVRRADRIVVLEAGRVVETGSHDALLHAGGVYARLHALQTAPAAGAAARAAIRRGGARG